MADVKGRYFLPQTYARNLGRYIVQPTHQCQLSWFNPSEARLSRGLAPCRRTSAPAIGNDCFWPSVDRQHAQESQ